MMTNIVGLMFIAWTLITAIGAELLQSSSQEEREKELFDELDKLITGNEAQSILEQVDVGERDAIKIGNCSVSYILSYKDYSCTLKQLSDPDFLKDNCSNTARNRGVRQFIKERIATRRRYCSQNYYPILQEAIADITPEDKRIFEGLFDTNLKKWSFGMLWRSNGKTKKDQRIKNCVKFIQKLSFVSTIKPISMPSSIDKRDKKELHSVSDWYILLEQCRRHMEKQSKPYYIPWTAPPYWFPPEINDKNDNDDNIELKSKCQEIVDIVASDKTKEKADALRKINDNLKKLAAKMDKRKEKTMINRLKQEKEAEKEWLRDFYNEMHANNPYEPKYLKLPRP